MSGLGRAQVNGMCIIWTAPAANESVWATAGEKMAGFVQQQLPHVLGQLLALEAGDDADALRRGVSALEMRASDAASCNSVYSEELGGACSGCLLGLHGALPPGAQQVQLRGGCCLPSRTQAQLLLTLNLMRRSSTNPWLPPTGRS